MGFVRRGASELKGEPSGSWEVGGSEPAQVSSKRSVMTYRKEDLNVIVFSLESVVIIIENVSQSTACKVFGTFAIESDYEWDRWRRGVGAHCML